MLRRKGKPGIPWPLIYCSLLLVFMAVNVQARDIPKLTARVNDLAGLLSPGTVQQLEGSLASFEREQSTQIVILTITSLDGDNLEDFAIRLAEQWQIGQQGLDNGAILIIARNERKIRIEVGYGLEGSLTDLVAGRIIRTVIRPHFKRGDFDAGVLAGTSAMMNAVTGEFSAASKEQRPEKNVGNFFMVLLMLLFFVGRALARHKIFAALLGGTVASLFGIIALGPGWTIPMLLFPVGAIGTIIAASITAASSGSGRSRSTRSGWGSSGGHFGGGGFGGGFGGGGFSGGGGGFGGGGASGGW
ncbi:MAG: methanol dehydrogenase [Desulfobulbus propionicus]|nr:MAG: methanol dehydrogenase [Desulfobulbus propionicus]